MAGRAVVDEAFLHRIDDDLRDVAVLTEPLTIAEKALAQVALIQSRLPGACRLEQHGGDASVDLGKHAVVLGAGPVGILGAMALALSGYKTWVYAREPSGGQRSRLVADFGATYVSASEQEVAAFARGVGNVDLVYEATGAAEPSWEMLKHLGKNAVFVFTGIPGRKAPIAIDPDHVMRRLVLNNQIVLGTVNAGAEDFAAAIAHLRRFRDRWPRALHAIIAARHPLRDFPGVVMERLPGVKHVIRMEES
jgi:threonine dehydrogenase-like Zn-dependent dehydrogenase